MFKKYLQKLYYYIYYVLLVLKWFHCRVIIDENVNTKNSGYYYNILFFIMAILYIFFNTNFFPIPDRMPAFCQTAIEV